MKYTNIVIFCMIFFAMDLQAAVCPTPLPKQYEHINSGNVVSAYFGNWDVYGANQYQIERIYQIADKLTHLFYGFMKPDDVTGKCKPHDIWADVGAFDDYQSNIGGNFAKLIELKKQFPHLKIILSVGGGTYNKNFLAIAQDEEKLHAFAQSCVNMLDFYDHEYRVEGKKRKNHLDYTHLFDGLDIDWEWDASTLTPQLSKRYTQFIQEVSRLLKIRQQSTGKESLLTVALPVIPTMYKNIDLPTIAENIDWFNVMAYDFFGPYNKKIGFNAPVCGTWSLYSIDGALNRIMDLGVSPEKLVLGLPLYGYVYENTDGYNAPITKQNKINAVAYNVIEKKYLENPSYKKILHHYESIPSLYSKKDRTFISYDDKESIGKKVDFARKKRMNGVVVWRLSGDNDQHAMFHQVFKGMNNEDF